MASRKTRRRARFSIRGEENNFRDRVFDTLEVVGFLDPAAVGEKDIARPRIEAQIFAAKQPLAGDQRLGIVGQLDLPIDDKGHHGFEFLVIQPMLDDRADLDSVDPHIGPRLQSAGAPKPRFEPVAVSEGKLQYVVLRRRSDDS